MAEFHQTSEEDIQRQVRRQRQQRSELAIPEISRVLYYEGVDMDMSVLDVISGEEAPIGKHIEDDPDNMVAIVRNTRGPAIVFSTSRAFAEKDLGAYVCVNPDSAAAFTGDRLVRLSVLGCPCAGVASYYPFKYMLDRGVQIFQFRETEIMTKTLMSHTARHMGDSYVSNAHCQSGTEQRYYQLYIPEPLLQPLSKHLTTYEHEHFDLDYSDWSIDDIVKLPKSTLKRVLANPRIMAHIPWEFNMDPRKASYLAFSGNIQARIYLVNLLAVFNNDDMRSWFGEDSQEIRYLFRLAPPYEHSALKRKLRGALKPESLAKIDDLKSIRDPPVADSQAPCAVLSNEQYEMLMSWIGEIFLTYNLSTEDSLRAVHITNEVICSQNILRKHWQLVACAAMFLTMYLNGHGSADRLTISEQSLRHYTSNTYSTKEILMTAASISAMQPHSMFMEIDISRIPESISQYHIYTKDYLLGRPFPAPDAIIDKLHGTTWLAAYEARYPHVAM